LVEKTEILAERALELWNGKEGMPANLWAGYGRPDTSSLAGSL
jgi:hypothetical protein